jgi:hypothetical protein
MSSISRIDQSLSLMIPRVFPQWVDEQTIVDIFHKQHLGLVYKVSIIRMPNSKKRSYPIYKAFVYFTAWYENEIAYNFQQRIFGPKKEARIVYDDPWYWVAFENKQQRLSNNDKRIIRLGHKSVNAWQKLDQLQDTLTECEELMREMNETTKNQKRMLEKFHQESTASKRSAGDHHHLRQTIDRFLDEEASNDVTMTDRDESKLPTMSVQECIDTFLDTEMANVEKSNEASKQKSWTQQNLEDAAMAMFGDELNLTETAINVAEAALAENEDAENEQQKVETKMDLDNVDDDEDDDEYYHDYYADECRREEDYDY